MKKDLFYIESLGCAKNSVDSRSMAELLVLGGMQETHDPEQAHVIIVNTCGFIQPAREESLLVLNEFASVKQRGQVLIAAGCLSEREKGQLLSEVNGLDAALGTRRWADIARVVKQTREQPGKPYLYFPETEQIIGDEEGIPRAAVQGASAYLKIADGCDRLCAFCAIPAIKGPMVSRPVDQVLKDAVFLQGLGVKEIILIAQDSTAYGRDLGLKDGLPALLETLVQSVPDVLWLRIMYTFPGSISDDLIRVMAGNPQVLPYLDLPLQHAHPDMLKRMKRPSDLEWIRRTIARMRNAIPSIALRTTFIVGYPGETEEEFEFLLDFLKEMRFDHVGIFPYYHEEGTSAYQIAETVPEELKQDRINRLATAQEEISLEINQSYVGKTLDVIIEGNGDGISAGRSYRDAPEIDGLVLLKEIIENGKMIQVQVTGAMVHDLIGRMIDY
ncbi:MAG: 30S ribosomal protein S12 methylthiotransferase RimO [Chloroflexi bacterium]|nr:30S ribosomal protein S12 methylthiotransferase RimO [Chloroflexota bacterium]